MQSSFRIAAIGELLWDLLPDGPQLGGAPANFAVMAANIPTASADSVFLISRVGEDPLGRKACEQLSAHRVKLDFLSTDAQRPTGTVTVTLNAEESPHYCIHEQTAWDYIPETAQLMSLAPTLDALCFGTLAQRSPLSRSTLRKLVELTARDCFRVFDVNLRAPYWTPETLAWGCARATIVKMNEEEVRHVACSLNAPCDQTPLQLAHFLLRQFPIELVAITRGGRGSLLVTREAIHDHPGMAVEVVDSIGAGDAFTAGLTHSMLRRCPLPQMAETANRWGAWAASQRGGMPSISNFLEGHPPSFSNDC